MMTICEIHGGQPGMLFSHDLVDPAGKMLPGVKVCKVDFLYDSQVTNRYHLSAKYAAQLGFQSETQFPLPDDYPAWVDDIRWWCVCAKCYDEWSRKQNVEL